MQVGRPFPFIHEMRVLLPVVLEAGELLLRMRYAGTTARQKADHSWVTEADDASASLIDSALNEAFPNDAILNEETHGQHAAARDWASAQRLWLIDPLDSTSSFVRGHPHYGILAALNVDGHPTLAMTYQPEVGELCWAIRGQGAWHTYTGLKRDESVVRSRGITLHEPLGVDAYELLFKTALPLKVSQEERLSLVTSHGRVSPGLEALLHRLGSPPAKRLPGSLKIHEVARGAYSAFISPPENPMSLWDLAAPQLILEEAGGCMTDLEGEPIQYRVSDTTWKRGVIASNGHVHAMLIKRLQAP